jgi:hypothetical protein
MGSFYIVFSCYARDCAKLSTHDSLLIFPGMVQVLSSVSFHGGCTDILSLFFVHGYITFHVLSVSAQQMSSFCAQW